uniref:NR LBD domain-containing protein n=1 Tax=Acrobeloides nanus TaxID=290746 RepID=A0A914DZW3_9BILA
MKLENGKDASKSVPSTSIETRFSDLTATSSVISRVPAMERFPHSRLIFKEDGKVGIDMAPLEALINEILSSPNANPIAPGIKLTFMQQLNYGFTLFNSEFKPKEPVTVTNEVDRYALFKHHEKFMVVLSKILMLCDKFACLDFDDKFILFKNSWYIFYHIERHYTSIEYFGKAKEDLRVLLDDKIAIDYNDAGYHLKDIDRKIFARNLDHWMSFRNKFIKYLMNPMKDLQITQYEIAFLLSQILWNVQGPTVPPGDTGFPGTCDRS